MTKPKLPRPGARDANAYDTPLMVRLTSASWRRLDDLAWSNRRTRSAMARVLIDIGLASIKQGDAI